MSMHKFAHFKGGGGRDPQYMRSTDDITVARGKQVPRNVKQIKPGRWEADAGGVNNGGGILQEHTGEACHAPITKMSVSLGRPAEIAFNCFETALQPQSPTDPATHTPEQKRAAVKTRKQICTKCTKERTAVWPFTAERATQPRD